jgi:hypothetical protein
MMQIPLLTTSLMLYAALTSAAPSSTLRKRDMCTLIGVHDVSQVIGGGGPGQPPIVTTIDGVEIDYVGGVVIKGDVPGAIAIGAPRQTFQPRDTNLPSPITYIQEWSTGGFLSCSVEYEGRTYTGTPSTKSNASGSNSRCRTDFECEGNIAGY